MLSVTTPPEVTPISVDELKAHLRIDIDAEDELLQTYIEAATSVCQSKTNRVFVNTTFAFQCVPYGGIVIVPKSPLVEVVSVVDSENQAVTFTIDQTRPFAVLKLATSPETVTVTFTAGYGEDASDVPQPARQAVRVLAGHFWRQRDDTAELPAAVDALLDTIRLRVVSR